MGIGFLRESRGEGTLPPGAVTGSAPGLTNYGAAVLVDEGQLSLDAPVREYVPGFAVSDAAGTLEITMRDLLSHRSGIGFHDYLAEDRGLTREELVQRRPHLRNIPFAQSPRVPPEFQREDRP